jgi:hypothetical protein
LVGSSKSGNTLYIRGAIPEGIERISRKSIVVSWLPIHVNEDGALPNVRNVHTFLRHDDHGRAPIKAMDTCGYVTLDWIREPLSRCFPKNINEAETVLAFPLDADDTPLLEDQHVFAFLPLRRAGYKVRQFPE